MTVNADLTNNWFFQSERNGKVLDAFGSIWVVTIPRVFKLSAGAAEAQAWGVTLWWSAVYPYQEDDEGALGRYLQARMNKIDMSAMARYMSAVCIDWNTLENYIEVRTTEEIKFFWGTFAPHNKWNDEANRNIWTERTVGGVNTQQAGVSEMAQLPERLGVLEAWQFYIPNLQDQHIERCAVLPAHDMYVLAAYFGLN